MTPDTPAKSGDGEEDPFGPYTGCRVSKGASQGKGLKVLEKAIFGGFGEE